MQSNRIPRHHLEAAPASAPHSAGPGPRPGPWSAQSRLAVRLALLLSVCALGRVEARTILVAQDASGEFKIIQQAILASHHGDVVEVAPGTYHERLYFGGRAITVRSQQGPATTVIDADGVASVVVMDILESPASVLDGFTLRNGLGTPIRSDQGTHARGAGAAASPERSVRQREEESSPLAPMRGRFGGGILLLAASPTLRNLVIEDNRAEFGGGLYALQTEPRLENCRFLKNTAGVGGGACLEMTDGAVLKGCEFRGNLGVVGGGVALLQGSAVIQGCRFERNLATEGGALHLLDCADPTQIRETIFLRNRAPDGAAVLALGSALSMLSCTAAANESPGAESASVFYRDGSSGSLTRVILAAGRGGPPLLVENSDVDVSCCDLWPSREPAGSLGGENLAAWPGFCDLGTGDLRLRPDSPCLPEHAPPGCGLIGALPLGCGSPSPGNTHVE